MVKVAYLRNPSEGVNYHRLELPLSHLVSEVIEVHQVDIIDVASGDFDVVIFNRFPLMQYPLGAIVKLKQSGVKIIYDLDDYWTRPLYNLNHSQQYEKSYTTTILKYLKLADVVWVSTQNLLEKVNGVCDSGVLVPNALDYSEPMWNVPPQERDKLTYGWVGGINHQLDFATLKNELKERYKAQPVLCGLNGKVDEYWNFLGKVMAGGNEQKVKYYNTLPVEKYGALYSTLDIVVLPSYNDTFSLCKSNLKLLEAGAYKLPVISNGGVYKEVNGKIGVRATGDNFKKGLKRLIESKSMREEYGNALHEYTTTKYNLQTINEIRRQSICS